MNTGEEIQYHDDLFKEHGPPSNDKERDPSNDTGIVDEEAIDRFFQSFRPGPESSNDDDGSFLGDSRGLTDDYDDIDRDQGHDFFQNPNRRLLDRDASIIPGSPFSKPPVVETNRPVDTLPVARLVNGATLLLTFGTVGFLVYVSVVSYTSRARIALECFLALVSFFGLFWSFRVLFSSYFSMFISTKAFRTNTKFCSIVPEVKLTHSPWLDVTIQIPISSEPLREIILPTLKSFTRARDHYIEHSGARCNLVVCDDYLMVLLRDNFAAAEVLWNEIENSRGQLFHLGTIIRKLPRPVRQHLKGLSSRSVHEAFYRMLYYFHNRIGFVARSLYEKSGNSPKESNLNSHLRLVFGAQQLREEEGDISMIDALLHVSHNEDGSRFVMFGNNIEEIGELLVVGGSDMRISESLILKTVPEFMNDHKLAFTQHVVTAKPRQRQESYFTKMMATYYDFVYRGHYIFSSAMGCHPPLSVKSIVIRTAALRQCSKVRMLRKTQRWLRNIGIDFLPMDQVGFSNLAKTRRVDYWAEDQIWSGFETMLEIYNLGFNGRYCAYPNNCGFQVGIPRTFDEFSSAQRRASMGAHEVVFNSIADMIGGKLVFAGLFKTLIKSNIPSYYKGYLVSHLFSYLIGGTFFFCFMIGAIIRILEDSTGSDHRYYNLSASSAIALVYIAALLFGNFFFILATLRLRLLSPSLLAEKRRWCCSTLGDLLRYTVFQICVEPVSASAFSFLGALDHFFIRSILKPLRKRFDEYRRRCDSLSGTIAWNIGSWYLALVTAALSYATIVRSTDWDPHVAPPNWLNHLLFAGPGLVLAYDIFVAPLVLNPYIWGWPFVSQENNTKVASEAAHARQRRSISSHRDEGGEVIDDLGTFLKASRALDTQLDRLDDRADVTIVSRDLMTTANSTESKSYYRRELINRANAELLRAQALARSDGSTLDRFGFPVSPSTPVTQPSSSPRSQVSIQRQNAVSRKSSSARQRLPSNTDRRHR